MAVGAKAIISSEQDRVSDSFWERLLREWRDNKTAYLLLLPSLFSFVVLVIFPLASTIAGAFSETDAVGRITDFGTLGNFQALTEDSYIPGIIRQTFLFAFGTVALTVLLSFPLALILNQKFPGAIVARALLLLPWAAPLAISSMTWRWIFHDQLGALNYLLHLTGITQASILWLSKPWLAFVSVMFVEVWSSIPFMTVTFLAGLQSIPPHIYDAAKMDGANAWHEFWDMTVPQMKTVFMIVTLLSVIWAFRSFTVIWVLTQGNPFYRTDISVTYLYKLAFKNLTFGQGYGLAFATFIVLLIFSVIYTRVLRSEESG
jgi:multiple sugar transport system permease protein